MVSAGLGLAVTLHSEVFLGVLSRAARDDEQRALMQAGLRGEAIGCFAVTEATGGSDLAAVNTTARRTKAGWHIHGEKRYVSNGGRATHALVLAQMDGYVNRNALTLFIVPLRDPGVTIPGFFPKLGTNSCDAAHIVFDGEFSESTQLGPPGGGMLLLMEALQYERMAVSAQLVAVAQASLRLAAAWARKRQQFGTRLLALQAIRHRLADVWAETLAVEALLALTVRSAIEGTDVGRATAALKLRCAAVAQKAVDEAMQILGGRGYTANFPLEGWYRDVRLARIGAGTDEVMRELIAADLDSSDMHYDKWLGILIQEDRAWIKEDRA